MHFIVFCLLYFLPSIIAHRKHAFMGVFLLNLFLGWTVIGWFVALIWACTAEECPRVYAVAAPYAAPAPPPPGTARYCSRCGAQSAGVGSYCWNCGARV
jgi:Superinfection immunity protein